MIGNIFKKVFGSRNSRLIKDYAIRVKKINDLEQVFEKKSDQELKLFTLDLKKRYLDSQNLNELLEEAYAAVREASKRTLGLRHFDEQLLGGIALHELSLIHI